MKPDEDWFVYVALTASRDVRVLVVDCLEMKRSLAKDMPKWIREGLIVERWSAKQYRAWVARMNKTPEGMGVVRNACF